VAVVVAAAVVVVAVVRTVGSAGRIDRPLGEEQRTEYWLVEPLCTEERQAELQRTEGQLEGLPRTVVEHRTEVELLPRQLELPAAVQAYLAALGIQEGTAYQRAASQRAA